MSGRFPGNKYTESCYNFYTSGLTQRELQINYLFGCTHHKEVSFFRDTAHTVIRTMLSASRFARFGPSPSVSELRNRERRFVLDCVAVDSIARDYSHSLPKLGSVIPPYNPQADKNAKGYFRTKPVPPLLKRTGQSRGGTSIHGRLADRFNDHGAAALYVTRRNTTAGAGYSREQVEGHSQFLASVRPVCGYNGLYGFRRNTPSLRRLPSAFGVADLYPIY